MSDQYKAKSISGQSWQRMKAIEIVCNYQQIPVVRFIEENIIQFGTEILNTQLGSVEVALENMKEQIDVVNIETLESTGKTTTVGDMYAALLSYYLKLASSRDSGAQKGIDSTEKGGNK